MLQRQLLAMHVPNLDTTVLQNKVAGDRLHTHGSNIRQVKDKESFSTQPQTAAWQTLLEQLQQLTIKVEQLKS